MRLTPAADDRRPRRSTARRATCTTAPDAEGRRAARSTRSTRCSRRTSRAATRRAPGGDPRYADPAKPTTLPPQTQATIGDLLDAKGVTWAWYGGAWNAASAGTPEARDDHLRAARSQFQAHHQPFNYYAALRSGDARRRPRRAPEGLRHRLPGRRGRRHAAARSTFYKPQGNLNQHPGYASVADGDAHIADVIAKLQASPQWKHMLIVVTYDENGGFWDHARGAEGRPLGPGHAHPGDHRLAVREEGLRRPHAVRHRSILRFITHRWSLPPLPGSSARRGAARRTACRRWAT